MWRLRPLVATALLTLTACGGLYSGSADGGTGGGTGGSGGGLGPPNCMRVLTDGIQVASPVGKSAFTDIAGLAFDSARNLHVLNRSTPDASFVDVMGAPSFGLVRSYGLGSLGPVRDLVIDAAGTSYVLEDFEFDPPQIKKFNSGGTLTGSFVANGGTQDQGQGLAFDGAGKLNVSGLSKVFRYETSGTFVDAYGTSGKGVGKMLYPTGLAWDGTTQSMWVADLFQNFVERYTPGSSTQLSQFGGRGVENGKFDGNEPSGNTFYGPNKVAVDAQGKVYASDPFASRLQKFAANGGYLGQFKFGSSSLFGAMAIHPDTGILYVARGAAIDVICPF